eukprot:1153405-Pelagomonas_calceolata.AAC.1
MGAHAYFCVTHEHALVQAGTSLHVLERAHARSHVCVCVCACVCGYGCGYGCGCGCDSDCGLLQVKAPCVSPSGSSLCTLTLNEGQAVIFLGMQQN